MFKMEADFSGYATRANVKCTDGRTIAPDAFAHQDQVKVPLVWQHMHGEPAHILGHAILEKRDDGVYAYGFFNSTPAAQNTKIQVEHGDITALSIYANQLVEKAGKVVVHGQICEVSLCLAGANKGATIDFVAVQHSDGSYTDIEDEAVIKMYQPLELAHSATEEVVKEEEDVDTIEHADGEGQTVKEIFDTLNPAQKQTFYFMLSQAINGSTVKHGEELEHSVDDVKASLDTYSEAQREVAFYLLSEAIQHSADVQEPEDQSAAHADADDTTISTADADNQKGTTSMAHNAFDSQTGDTASTSSKKLSHADTQKLFSDAKRGQGVSSFKALVENYATDTLQHGIDDLDVLFPDARAVTSTPDFLKRRTEWVSEVMTGTRHTPFSRIKSLSANLTLDEARARGYVKGSFKKEEFFAVSKRVTTPQTIYKKQQLDRDDILDISDFDVVAWLKGEMRLMLEEEIARAVLIGDGRSNADDDKIKEENVRPIATDNDLYVTQLYVNLDNANSSAEEVIEALVLNRRHYRGTGTPTLFCGETLIAQLLSVKDAMQRRVYTTMNDLTAVLRVSNIVPVEVMDAPSSSVVAILVNLQDYTIGADRGGDVALFDDFDIDFNQYKYLIETRIAGALTKVKSAIVVNKVASTAVLVDPVAPTWNPTAHSVTVASTPTGLVYKNKMTGSTLASGTPVVLADNEELIVIAVPQAGYYLASNAADEFRFNYDLGRIDAGLN
jgi:HK97 family phage prohead protease